MWEAAAQHVDDFRYCVHCGRKLVDIMEPDSLYDTATGERPMVTWRQCPRYPRNGWQAFFRGPHESFRLDHPTMAREWRGA